MSFLKKLLFVFLVLLLLAASYFSVVLRYGG